MIAFRCSGLWPRSANHWPPSSCPWPPAQIVQEVKGDGFDLLSKECITAQVSYKRWNKRITPSFNINKKLRMRITLCQIKDGAANAVHLDLESNYRHQHFNSFTLL